VKTTEIAENGVLLIEKRLTSRELAEPEAILRLQSEGVLLERLGGRVTPKLVARGEDAAGPFHRTEKIAHPMLSDRLEGEAALDTGFIERAARKAFAALAEIHSATDEKGPLSVVHADLSPTNLAVSDDGEEVIVLDFNLASWRESAPRDGAFRGTIAYSAPEVARGEAPTVRSDLFSLAAIFLHAMTGIVPRSGDLAALVVRAAEEPLRKPEHEPLASRGPAHGAILSCLAHDPNARPNEARAVLAAMGLC
jgi:serine/threonine protein kinase